MDRLNNSFIFKLITLVVLVSFIVLGSSYGQTLAGEVCLDNNGWVKIYRDDLTSYPVDGATQYCFEAGSGKAQDGGNGGNGGDGGDGGMGSHQ